MQDGRESGLNYGPPEALITASVHDHHGATLHPLGALEVSRQLGPCGNTALTSRAAHEDTAATAAKRREMSERVRQCWAEFRGDEVLRKRAAAGTRASRRGSNVGRTADMAPDSVHTGSAPPRRTARLR